MTIMIDRRLAELAKALEDLPADVQADVLAEIEARIETLTQSRMTDEQRRIVEARLRMPREIAAPQEVEALLRRFKARP